MRWWQPQHEGADHSDWALDNVLIAGSDPRAQISDTFGGVALPNHERAPADGTLGRIGQVSEQEETPIGMAKLDQGSKAMPQLSNCCNAKSIISWLNKYLIIGSLFPPLSCF